MSLPEVVPCSADVLVTATGPLRHMCPFIAEIDEGQVTITWWCAGATFEIHSLAEYLAGWKDAEISHEQVVDRIYHDLATTSPLVVDVTVAARFVTAGLSVEVGNALPGQPVTGTGA